MSRNTVVLCDFDGTITNVDTGELVLRKFAEGDWRVFDKQLEKGEITLEECMQRQCSMIKVSKSRIIKELEKVVSFRPDFEKLVENCRSRGIPFVIVSGGLDFVIRHFIELKGLQGSVEVYTAKTRFTSDGIRFTFPRLMDETSLNFKDDLVRSYRERGRRVIYIGDGLSDFHAVGDADSVFVIEGSKLAERCRREGIPHKEIRDFQQVIEQIF